MLVCGTSFSPCHSSPAEPGLPLREDLNSMSGYLLGSSVFLKIPRPKWIEVEYTNENGERTQTRLDGLTARCYLHELDHLNGVKFTDYVGAASILQAARKQQKLIKKIVRRKK